jgi:serine/threonine protein kinase
MSDPLGLLEAGFRPVPGYTLGRRIGAGTFGVVWEAFDAEGQPAALKFIDCRSRPSVRVRSEIRVLQELRELHHPNIIELRGVHAVVNYLVLCMERADGNLAELHATYFEEVGTDVPEEHALELLGQAAGALDFLAELRLTGLNAFSGALQHCDVKPANLLLVGETLKVADFGLCAATSTPTHKSGCRGTPPYAAPELYRGMTSSRTDQYALAVTYCELVAGNRYFRELAEGPCAPHTLPIDLTRVPERQVPVLARALSHQPFSRYRSCREFIAALAAAARPPRRSFH